MGISLKSKKHVFTDNKLLGIENKRVNLVQFRHLKHFDISYKANNKSISSYPYLESIEDLSNILPLPKLLLGPAKSYDLYYNLVDEIDLTNIKDTTVIYFHGLDGFSEDNSILQSNLLSNNCNVIRIKYDIDLDKEGINYPEQANDMIKFLNILEEKTVATIVDELNELFEKMLHSYSELLNKRIVIIGHSTGAGIAASFISNTKLLNIDSFINLDGTLFSQSTKEELTCKQVHLSQDLNFDIDWLKSKDLDETQTIGVDYGLRINDIISKSKEESYWIQIKDSSHYTFTDIPDLLVKESIMNNYSGSKDSAQRIRQYILDYILKGKINIKENDINLKILVD